MQIHLKMERLMKMEINYHLDFVTLIQIRKDLKTYFRKLKLILTPMPMSMNLHSRKLIPKETEIYWLKHYSMRFLMRKVKVIYFRKHSRMKMQIPKDFEI